MALYELATGQQAPVVDQDSNPILDGATTAVIADETIVSIIDVDGAIFIKALAVGTTAVTFTPTGSDPVEHDVTVSAAPFDWSLGTPVAS
jgi:hypothetical protein